VNRLIKLLTIGTCSFGVLLAVACTHEATAPDLQLSVISHNEPGKPLRFTRCTPQPHASSSARIGPKGGTLKAGKHTLNIPAGALKRSVLITMEAPSDSLNYVVFGPEGLTFEPGSLPTLTMSYRNCAVPGPTESWLEIIYTDDALTTLLETTEPIPADPLNYIIGAQLKHFSRYAVAY
jgi:hypothetical protein